MKYIVKVGYSGYMVQEYEVDADTKEDATALLETAISEGGLENFNTMPYFGEKIITLSLPDMEVTGWDIQDIEEEEGETV